MMKHEFEKLAKRSVTDEQFRAIHELYMASDLDKYEFVKSVKGLLKTIPEEKTERKILTISTVDNSWCEYTPNGCYIHTVKAELVDVDIKSGKFLLRKIPDSYELGYSVDLHHWDDRIKWVA